MCPRKREANEKIRDIRASERRAYQKITDVFQECSSDYQSKAEETQLFYQIVQNQLHFATTGKTAAEIIYGRADDEPKFLQRQLQMYKLECITSNNLVGLKLCYQLRLLFLTLIKKIQMRLIQRAN